MLFNNCPENACKCTASGRYDVLWKYSMNLNMIFATVCKCNILCYIQNNAAFFPLIHFVICVTTGPLLLPKLAVHRPRSCTSCFIVQYPLTSLQSFNSCLSLLTRLLLTSILPSLFPSIMWFRRYSLVPTQDVTIQLDFLLLLYVG